MKAKEAIADSPRKHLEEYNNPPQDVRLEKVSLYLRRDFLGDLVFLEQKYAHSGLCRDRTYDPVIKRNHWA